MGRAGITPLLGSTAGRVPRAEPPAVPPWGEVNRTGSGSQPWVGLLCVSASLRLQLPLG